MEVEIVITIKDGKIKVKKVTIKAWRNRGGGRWSLHLALACRRKYTYKTWIIK